MICGGNFVQRGQQFCCAALTAVFAAWKSSSHAFFVANFVGSLNHLSETSPPDIAAVMSQWYPSASPSATNNPLLSASDAFLVLEISVANPVGALPVFLGRLAKCFPSSTLKVY
jgi:hypothetical protein